MSYQNDRDRFLMTAGQIGLTPVTALALLRHATTLQRLAEAQCNGDYPADNGERKVKPCPRCEMQWVPSAFKRNLCPDCRTNELVAMALAGSGYAPVFGGDPRGAVLRIVPDGTPRDQIENGTVRGIYIPTR